MERMKKFFIYAILVIIVLLSTDFLANIILETGYRQINYEIATTSPEIIITQAETTNANGRIKGNVTNKTDTLMQGMFVKVELMSDIGNKLGTEYIQVGNLQPDESKEFKLNYRYSNVNNLIISIVNEEIEEEKTFEYDEVIEKGLAVYKLFRIATIATIPSIFFIGWLVINAH